MAKLDLETSGESVGYSDSFEIEESISLNSSVNSDINSAAVDEAKKTQTSSSDTQEVGNAVSSVNGSRTKPKVTLSEMMSSAKGGKPTASAHLSTTTGTISDLGRTVRSPLNITNETRSQRSSTPGRSGSKFKCAAQNVQTMQSVVNTVKSFNDSLEVRDTVYGEWLARKTSQVSREKISKIQAKKMEEEKKRKKEVHVVM